MKLKKIPDFSDTTVIIPTLNEGKNIGLLLETIFNQYKGINAIVCDDGSADETAEVAKSFKDAKLIDRKNEKTKGLTASVIDGIKAAETEYSIVIDGDLQHPTEKIGEIREKLAKSDVVGAARKKVLVDWPIHRRIISAAATMLAKLRLMKNLPDPLTGYFGVKTKLFREVIRKHETKFEKQGYKVFFDMLKYVPKNTKVEIVYYDFGLRQKGESKIKIKHILIFLRSIFK